MGHKSGGGWVSLAARERVDGDTTGNSSRHPSALNDEQEQARPCDKFGTWLVCVWSIRACVCVGWVVSEYQRAGEAVGRERRIAVAGIRRGWGGIGL